MTRVTDHKGQHSFSNCDYPLSIGGDSCDIHLPETEDENPVAHIGLEQGHPFIHATQSGRTIWHNHEKVEQSVWLKSGDQLLIGDWVIHWQVTGDQLDVQVVKAVPQKVIPPSPIQPVMTSPPVGHSIPTGHVPLLNSNEQSTHRSYWWLLAGISPLLLAALFVLFAIPVEIEIEPKPDKITVEGFPLTVELMGHHLAIPGEYQLIATKKGYHSLQAPLEIQASDNPPFHFKMEKLPGRITIQTQPVNAQLSIDGRLVGDAPLKEMELSSGEHSLLVEAERFVTINKTIEVIGAGEQQQFSFDLKPDWAAITLISTPDGAVIKRHEIVLGKTPATLELLSGKQTLIFEKPQYQTMSLELEVVAGEPRRIKDIELIKATGQLELKSSPSGSTVAVDGQYQGRTPLSLTLVPDLTHSISLSKPGYVTREKRVTIASEEVLELTVKLQPEYGVVFISTQPVDAELLVDGKRQPNANTRLKLSSRTHKIELRKPGYISYNSRITPNASTPQTLEVVLQPETSGNTSRGSGVTKSAQKLFNSVGQGMILVDAGEPFFMGASRREPGRRANENIRQVQVAHPFYMGAQEVTNGEFRQFKPGHQSGSSGKYTLDSDGQPVVNVSWEDAARYANWLSQKEKLPSAYEDQAGKPILIRPVTNGYRLPSEVEWAYAARLAGREKIAKYPWPGNSFPPNNLAGNYADIKAQALLPQVMVDYNDSYVVTAPGGKFPPNPVGLYDLEGNVAEWIGDYYGVYPGAAGKLVKDPQGPTAGRHHLVRGASWKDATITQLRLSYRDYAEESRNDLGFRLVRYAQ
ncbi:MAG: PEGA domain-containing protein [Gammaproteobacteria bacterium]|nr:PEGA domain-containing protein [Gammaproteobacteria bacterium]